MCSIFFLYNMHPEFRLILASNRDEFTCRPTSPAGFWDDETSILAGRDLQNMGTWLGITKTGRIAAITNYRDPASLKAETPSRGALVSDFLSGNQPSKNYLEHVKATGHIYNDFNLITCDNSGLYYYSNRSDKIMELQPGLYGLSNHLLDTPWPKVERGKEMFKDLLNLGRTEIVEKTFNILADNYHPPEDTLPDTGVGPEMERLLSPIFISTDGYGTRSSSVILIGKSNDVTFIERSFIQKSETNTEQETREFSFQIK
ncbi:MAG: NRDE family protein [Desulfobacterales bacterium]|nr:NRDE family protein [Desulfobacterales bacterium]